MHLSVYSPVEMFQANMLDCNQLHVLLRVRRRREDCVAICDSELGALVKRAIRETGVPVYADK